MKVRQLVEFFVFPKSFNILSFYSKGNYALRIKLTLQNKKDGQCTYGFPVLLQGRQARKEEGKKASVNCVDSYYQTEHFFVTFSQQKVVFNSGCIFKTEYNIDEEYQTYLDFQIIYTNSRRKSTNEGEQTVRVVKTADRRRLYINSFNSVNRFKRVLFDDCDYFSFSDVLIISESFGQKIRLHDYNLGQFNASDVATRQLHHHQAFESWVGGSKIERSRKLKDMFDFSVQNFYSKMIIEKIIRYRKLCQTYQKFRFFMSSMNNSSMADTPHFDHLQWLKTDIPRSEQIIIDMYECEEADEVFMAIYQESHCIIRNIKFVWQNLIDLLIAIKFNLIDQLASKEIEQERQTKAKWLLSYSQIHNDFHQQKRREFLSKREEILKRSDIYEDHDIHHPLLIIQNYVPETQTENQSGEIQSLVVMIHGYQGSCIDLEKARNFMNIYNPFCHALLVKTIEDDIDNPIQKLGEAVAQEIRLHMLNSLNNYRRINFIGYSLGGIIARESLKHLQRFKDLMNIFISFASPHAGIRDASNPFVRTGIWFLTNFDKNKNLKQLNCQPNQDSEIVALTKLSECDSISWFKRFVAVSSRDDCFVPYESSRLQESRLGDLTRQMCVNLKQKIKRLERVDVWFDANHLPGTLDKMIGRRSHIQFLENRLFLDVFFAVYAPFL